MGSINLTIQSTTLQNLEHQFWGRVLGIADLNGDGELSMEEFVMLMQASLFQGNAAMQASLGTPCCARAAMPPRSSCCGAQQTDGWLRATLVDRLQRVSAVADVFAMQAFGSDLTEEETANLYRRADADGSGSVSENELANCLAARCSIIAVPTWLFVHFYC